MPHIVWFNVFWWLIADLAGARNRNWCKGPHANGIARLVITPIAVWFIILITSFKIFYNHVNVYFLGFVDQTSQHGHHKLWWNPHGSDQKTPRWCNANNIFTSSNHVFQPWVFQWSDSLNKFHQDIGHQSLMVVPCNNLNPSLWCSWTDSGILFHMVFKYPPVIERGSGQSTIYRCIDCIDGFRIKTSI